MRRSAISAISVERNRVYDTLNCRSVRRGLFALILCALATSVEAAAPESAGSNADVTVIQDAYRDALYRTPSPDEIQAWQAARTAGQSEQSLIAALQLSDEYQAVRHHRREETRDLLTSGFPLILIYILTYLLLVRGRPDRRLIFAVFVFAFTPLAMNYGYVYQKIHFGDFSSFYYGADYIYNQGLSPYGTVLSEEVERHIFPFFHPPPSVVIFYPWSLMSYHTAIIVGNLGNQIALCVLLYLLIVRNRKDSPVLSVCLLLYVINFHPVTMTMDYGQVNLWTTVFICLFMHACIARKSSALTGLSLACAIIFKIYPACLLAYLVLKKQWKAIAWCAAGISGCALVALITIPWHIWEAWWETVGSRGLYGGCGPVGIFSPAGPWNQGFNGLMMRIFTDSQFNVALIHNPTLGKVLAYGLSLVAVGMGGGLLWLRDRRGLNDAKELDLGLVLVITSLVVPLSWIHHNVMLLPAIAATARQLCITPRRSTWSLFVLSACALAWNWSCLPDEGLMLFRGGPSMLIGSLRLYGLIGLLLTILMLLYEPLRKGRPATTTRCST